MTETSHWRWKCLLACQLSGALILGSWLNGSPVRPVWDRLDLMIFVALNETLPWGSTWQVIWAVANNRAFDFLVALLYLIGYLHFSLAGERRFLNERLVFGCFIAVYAFVVLELSRNVMFTFERLSPTLAVDGAVRLSELVPWADLKDASGDSFPGDHAIALWVFSGMTWFYAGRRYGILAVAGAFLFILPRIMSGAHWFSDVAVGSTFVSLFSLSLALATPMHALVLRAGLNLVSGSPELIQRLGALLRAGTRH